MSVKKPDALPLYVFVNVTDMLVDVVHYSATNASSGILQKVLNTTQPDDSDDIYLTYRVFRNKYTLLWCVVVREFYISS